MIDERIVSMKFDNSNFEKNANQSMSTLDKLKEKLSFGNNSFDSLDKAASKINMSGLGSAVETVSTKFSALEAIGVGALMKIGSQAVRAGEQVLKSLTIDPIATGFNEYEIKMGSIQTIMAGTGESLETVSDKLNELNKYADRTIYSFSDMTNNIGKFTNAGVNLNDAVAAIQGVANEAAVSGANAQQASHAMYNFAQALSSGYVKLIDWKSIENANMATVEFKEQLIETAVACGTLEEQADGMYNSLTTNANGETSGPFNSLRNFNDSLQAQWMTTEVLTQTLAKYADETTEIGAKAFAAAQDVKTFSQMMDTLKEAAQSGWAESMEIIFGNFEEAKVLWTNIGNKIEQVLSTSSKARNDLLQGWKDKGGRDSLFAAVNNLMTAVGTITNTIKKGFKDVFGDLDSSKLVQITENIEKFTKALIPTEPQLKKLETLIAGISSVFQVFGNVVKKVFSIFIPYAGTAEDLFYNLAESVGSALLSFSDFITNSYFFTEGIENITAALHNMINAMDFKGAFVDLKDGLLEFINIIKDIIFNIEKLPIELKSLYDAMGGGLPGGVLVFFRSFANLIDSVGSSLSKLTGLDISSVFSKITNVIIKFGQFLSNLIGKIDLSVFGEFTVQGFANGILSGISKVWKSAKAIATTVIQAIVQTLRIGSPSKETYELGEWTVKGFFNGIIESIKNLGNNVFNAFENFLNKLKISIRWDDVIKQLFTFDNAIKVLSLGGLLKLIQIVNRIMSLSDIFSIVDKLVSPIKSLSDVLSIGLTSISKSLNNFTKAAKIKAFGIAALQVAGAIALIAGAMALISYVPFEQLKQAGIVFGAIAVALGIFVGVMSKVVKSIDSAGIAGVMLSLTASMLLLSTAVKKLSKLTGPELATGLGALAGAIVIIAGAIWFMETRIKKESFMKGSIILISIALAVSRLIKAFNNINTDDMAGKITTFITIVGLLAGLSAIMQEIKGTGAIGILAVAASISIVLKTLNSVFSEEADPNSIVAGIIKTVLAFSVLAGVLLLLQRDSVGIAQAGAGLLMIGGAILAVSFALRILSTITPDQITLGTIAIIGISGLITLLYLAFNFIASKFGGGKVALQATAGLLPIAGAIGIMGLIVYLLSSIPIAQTQQGILAITELSIIIGLLSGLLVHLGNVTQIGGESLFAIKKITQTLYAFVGLISILGIITVALGLFNIKTTQKGILAIVEMSGILVLLFGALNAISEKFKGNGKDIMQSMIGLASVIAVMSTSLALLSFMNMEQLFGSAVALAMVLTTLVAPLSQLNKINKHTFGVMLEMAVTIGIMAAALAVMSFLPYEQTLAAGLAISATLLALSVAMNQMEKVNVSSLASILGMVAVIAVLAGAMAGLSLINAEGSKFLMIGGALAILLLSLAASLWIVAAAGTGLAAATPGLLAFGATVLMVVGSIALLVGTIALVIAAVAAVNYTLTLLTNAFSALLTLIADRGPDIAAGVNVIATSVIAFISNMVIAITTGIATITAVIAAGMITIGTGIDKSLALVAASLSKYGGEIIANIGQIILGIAAAIGLGIENISASIGTGIVTIAKSLGDGMITFATTILDGIPGVVSAIVNLKNSIKSALFSEDDGGLSQTAEKAGVNVVSGLEKGLKKKSKLVTIASGLGTTIISAFSKRMEIHSPSKKMELLGINVDEGLINGLLSGEKTLNDVASELGFGTGESMISGLKDKLGSTDLGSIFGDKLSLDMSGSDFANFLTGDITNFDLSSIFGDSKGFNIDTSDLSQFKDIFGDVKDEAEESSDAVSKSLKITAEELEKYADDVIAGIYGNGKERIEKLGSIYAAVQNEVNKRLGSSVRHEVGDIEILTEKTREFNNELERGSEISKNQDLKSKGYSDSTSGMYTKQSKDAQLQAVAMMNNGKLWEEATGKLWENTGWERVQYKAQDYFEKNEILNGDVLKWAVENYEEIIDEFEKSDISKRVDEALANGIAGDNEELYSIFKKRGEIYAEVQRKAFEEGWISNNNGWNYASYGVQNLDKLTSEEKDLLYYESQKTINDYDRNTDFYSNIITTEDLDNIKAYVKAYEELTGHINSLQYDESKFYSASQPIKETTENVKELNTELAKTSGLSQDVKAKGYGDSTSGAYTKQSVVVARDFNQQLDKTHSLTAKGFPNSAEYVYSSASIENAKQYNAELQKTANSKIQISETKAAINSITDKKAKIDIDASGAKTAVNDVKTALDSVEQDLETRKITIRDNSKAYVTEIGETIKEEGYKQGKESGKQMVAGYAKGMTENKKLATDAAKSVANASKNSLNKTLKIQSPSRVFAESGKFADKGLAVGLIEHMAEVEDASEQVGTSAITSVTEALSKINYDSIDPTPTITPIIDSGNIALASGQIDSLLSRKQVSRISANYVNDNQQTNLLFDKLTNQMNSMGLQLGALIKAVSETKPVPVDVDVMLNPNAKGIFDIVKTEGQRYTRTTGRQPF